MSELKHDQTDSKASSENPFVVESPEKLTPQHIVDLFISDYTDIETIKQRKHTFIWGSRGSGKSMMFRYLEPRCQTLVYSGIDKFLDKRQPFLALYCPCKEGQINKTELRLLNDYSALIVSEHLINMVIADRLMDCLLTQFPLDFFSKEECETFANSAVRLFNRAAIAGSIEEANSIVDIKRKPLFWLQKLFFIESTKISEYLRDNAKRGGGVVYEGATSGYHDFLLPLMKLVKGFSALFSASVYIMLDDAGRLTEAQQTIVNSWVANRDQSSLCLKVSALSEDYRTSYTRDGGLIEQPHDYSEVNVEELYTHSKDDYSKKVRLIANRRLELAKLPTRDIEEFLPSDATEQSLLERFKADTGEEWERQGQPGRKNDYVTRYALPRLFQHLRETKKRKSYAGFQNMVHLSAGVIRDFLEPCYLMFDACVSSGEEPQKIRFIPTPVQDKVLHEYSERMLLALDDIRKKLPPEDWKHLNALKVLLESLGRLFYERLHDPEAREARLFSFTVRGQVPHEVAEVLDLGVRYRYFQLRTYSTKEGGGREYWYILNRRLCPIFKLDPTGFEGRISLTPDLLKLACENPEKFVRLRLKQSDEKDTIAGEELNEGIQPTLFSLIEEEEVVK